MFTLNKAFIPLRRLFFACPVTQMLAKDYFSQFIHFRRPCFALNEKHENKNRFITACVVKLCDLCGEFLWCRFLLSFVIGFLSLFSQLKSTDLVRVRSQEDLPSGKYKYYNHINSDSDSPTYIYRVSGNINEDLISVSGSWLCALVGTSFG